MANKFYSTVLSLKLPAIILAIYFLISIILLIVYFLFDFGEKAGALIGGGAVASVFGLMGLLMDYFNYLNTETLDKNGVVKFLGRRDDKKYYSEMISKSNRELKLLFETSNKFCEDFCTSTDGDDLLIRKLVSNENLTVKLLIAEEEFLDNHGKSRLSSSRIILERMIQRFPDRFLVKVYSHSPNHSIFLTDKDAVVGPYFPGVRGRTTRSIHFRRDSSFIEKYVEYFDEEWSSSRDYS